MLWPYPACALTVNKRKGPFCNLPCPQFSFHFFYPRLERVVYPLYSRLGIEVYTIFCQGTMVHHSQRIFDFHQTEFVGVSCGQIPDHHIPLGYVPIHEVDYWWPGVWVKGIGTQDNNPGSVFLFQFVKETNQKWFRFRLGCDGVPWDIVRPYHHGQRVHPIVVLQLHHIDYLNHWSPSKGDHGSLSSY